MLGLGVHDAQDPQLLEEKQAVLGHDEQRQSLRHVLRDLDRVEAARDLATLVLSRGNPLADVGPELLDLLLDLDTEVHDRVPVGFGHRSVEAQLLGAASKRPVRTDDLALPNRLHQIPEEIDLRLDTLDRLLDLLDGRRKGDGHDRELCGDRLLGRHGHRLQGAVGDDLAARTLPEQPVEPVAGGGQRS